MVDLKTRLKLEPMDGEVEMNRNRWIFRETEDMHVILLLSAKVSLSLSPGSAASYPHVIHSPSLANPRYFRYFHICFGFSRNSQLFSIAPCILQSTFTCCLFGPKKAHSMGNVSAHYNTN